MGVLTARGGVQVLGAVCIALCIGKKMLRVRACMGVLTGLIDHHVPVYHTVIDGHACARMCVSACECVLMLVCVCVF